MIVYLFVNGTFRADYENRYLVGFPDTLKLDLADPKVFSF
jgi:hypothetical protein